MENRMKSKIISVGTYRLIIDTGFKLDLHDIFYVPSVSKNLVFLVKLNLEGFSFTFVNLRFRMIKKFYFG